MPGRPSLLDNLRPDGIHDDGLVYLANDLDERHGAGKTFIGMALVEEHAVRRGQHVLIVVPAQLTEEWERELLQARLSAQVVSYHGFASDEQLADPGATTTRRVLSSDKDGYRLVVFDEAHALRNPDTIWYRAMSRLMGGTPRTSRSSLPRPSTTASGTSTTWS